MWSSQRYLKEGKLRNIDGVLLQSAHSELLRLNRKRPPIPPILSLAHLAHLSGVSHDFLRQIVGREVESPYRGFVVRKRSGGYRRISVPQAELKKVQGWIAGKILRHQPVHEASQAFSPLDSTVKCATIHCGAKWLIKMDVADFFGSITEIQAYRVFRQLGYRSLVAFELARICTDKVAQSAKYELQNWKARKFDYKIRQYQQPVLGRLPQGASTSPMLANLAMYPIDEELQEIATAHKLRYTRYSDDITFSTTEKKFTRQDAVAVIEKATRVLKSVGLFPNNRKTNIVPPGARKVVLGLLVDRDSPALSREFKDSLRMHLFFLLKDNGIENHAATRGFDSIGGLYRHILGTINYAKMVDEDFSIEMRELFYKVPWPSE